MKKINIQGKPYIPVNERLMEFWKDNPSWSIRTELVEAPQGKVRFKACIYDENGNLRATGHGEEKENSTFINKSSHLENCETSAIGRALGVLGIGIDTSLASYEEVANAMGQQEEPVNSHPRNNFDDREWITEAQFNKIVDRVLSGEQGVIEKALKTFKMRKDLREQLLKMNGGVYHG